MLNGSLRHELSANRLLGGTYLGAVTMLFFNTASVPTWNIILDATCFLILYEGKEGAEFYDTFWIFILIFYWWQDNV